MQAGRGGGTIITQTNFVLKLGRTDLFNFKDAANKFEFVDLRAESIQWVLTMVKL